MRIALKILALYPPLTAWVLFLVLHHIQNYRAARISKNVTAYLPDIDDHQKFVRDFHRQWANYLAEICVLFAGTSRDQVKNAVTFTNATMVQDHFAAGNKVLLISAHTANTDWVWQAISVEFEGQDAAVIGANLGNNFIDEMVLSARTRYGGRTIRSDDVSEKLVAAQHRPDLIFAVGDFKPRSQSNPKRDFLPFLNHRLHMHSSLPKLGRHLDMHLVYVDIQRNALGRFQATFMDLSPPPSAADLAEVQSAYISQVENSVRTNPPGWWFWSKRLLEPEKQV